MESPDASDTRDAYLYAMGIALTSAMLVPLNSVFYHIARMMALVMRVALLAAIYDKVRYFVYRYSLGLWI